MTDNHNHSFFGQKTGIIIGTREASDPYIYIKCCKKKSDGSWEKKDEMKFVKFNINEVYAILDVLKKNQAKWETFHSFNDIKTSIRFAWDTNDENLLWINIDTYSRPLAYPETLVLHALWEHIAVEKITFSTIFVSKPNYSQENSQYLGQNNSPTRYNGNYNNYSSINHGNTNSNNPNNMNYPNNNSNNGYNSNNINNGYSHNQSNRNANNFVQNPGFNQNQIQKLENKSQSPIGTVSESKIISSGPEGTKTLVGNIKKATERAILLSFENGNEHWVPKSVIKNNFNEEGGFQEFYIKTDFYTKQLSEKIFA